MGSKTSVPYTQNVQTISPTVDTARKCFRKGNQKFKEEGLKKISI